MKRLGFFKNACRNVRKAYFDRRTTPSEFCFEASILCNRRSLYWRTKNLDVRKTALHNKLTLNNYSSNGKKTISRATSASLKVNSGLKPVFSVIEDQCSGGERSSK